MEKGAEAQWIAVDWGTSHLRAYAVDHAGDVFDEKQSSDGMNRLKANEFEPALLRLIGPWLSDQRTTSVLSCGMVGARQGWVEAPYRGLPCAPVEPDELIKVPVQSSLFSFHIVPGLKQADPPDVMRGEETQIAGALASDKAFSGQICLPGTHSKWVSVSGGVIQSFKTHLTGELFALLSEQSILQHSVKSEEFNEAAFVEAVSEILNDGPFDTSKLFTLRASQLLEHTPTDQLRARLSGLLIGLELAATRSQWEGENIALVGEPKLTRLYALALGRYGNTVAEIEAKDATLGGLKTIADKRGV